MSWPWTKHPVDAHARWGLGELSRDIRCTFWDLFPLASRQAEKLGELPPLRQTARRLRMAKDTLRRHLENLSDHGLAEKNLFGRWRLSPVVETEARFPGRNGNGSNGSNGNGSSSVVENDNGQRRDGDLRQTRFEHDRAPPRRTPTPSRARLSTRATSRARLPVESKTYNLPVPSTSSSPVENPDPTHGLEGQIPDPDVRYLVREIAYASGRWAETFARPDERRMVRWMARCHRAALMQALREALDRPDEARNPGRWLNWRVRAIDEEHVPVDPQVAELVGGLARSLSADGAMEGES